MKDPSKQVHIPKAPKEKEIRKPKEMMANVQGSSAGAGSGSFGVLLLFPVVQRGADFTLAWFQASSMSTSRVGVGSMNA
jgi:hypothetical protein